MSELEKAIHGKESSVRRLNPDFEVDYSIGEQLDVASMEAYNPFTGVFDSEAAHGAMSSKELKKWMSDRPTGMLRITEVPVKNMGPYQDETEPQAVGFTYLYNDEKTDPEFLRRAAVIREKTGLSPSDPVWEMNFWFYEGTSDAIVKKSVKATLQEFEKKHPNQPITVMFADAGDVRDAYEERVKGAHGLKDLQNVLKRAKAEDAFQDTRTLKSAGFSFLDRVAYLTSSKVKDFAYVKKL